MLIGIGVSVSVGIGVKVANCVAVGIGDSIVVLVGVGTKVAVNVGSDAKVSNGVGVIVGFGMIAIVLSGIDVGNGVMVTTIKTGVSVGGRGNIGGGAVAICRESPRTINTVSKDAHPKQQPAKKMPR